MPCLSLAWLVFSPIIPKHQKVSLNSSQFHFTIMIFAHKNLLSLAFALGLIASTSLFAAPLPITVINAGFESPILGENASTDSGIPGWTPYSTLDFYVWNPSTDFYGAGAPEGQNIADLFGSSVASGCSQFLQGAEGQLQVDTTYALKVKVGNNLLDTFAGYTVQLVVDDEVIAQDDNSQSPGSGSFVAISVNYVYDPADSHLLGSPIEIRLLSKGLGGSVGDVNFDNVQITYDTNNMVANAGGSYRLSEGDSLNLDGSGSLPSLGGTITTYEWDLNSNDNSGIFNADVTGATPLAIAYTTLVSTYGMALGENTIRLRVGDGYTTVTSSTTVTISELYTYTGPDAYKNNLRWTIPSYWDKAAVPSGAVDVLLTDNTKGFCWSATTPTYSGNLYMGTGASISIGWTTGVLPSYNCMGTPGSTTIFMEEGTSISARIGGQPIIPAIQLNGDANLTLGSSTQGGAHAQFYHGINGPHKFRLQGNSTSNCIADLNTANTFSELIMDSTSGYSNGGCKVRARAAGSLGTGNVTMGTTSKGGSYLLEIDADNAMADTGTLSIEGDSLIKLWMDGNDTIGALILNGLQLPAGTYGSTASSANNKLSWIGGDKVLTVAGSAPHYWDTNGLTAGAGGATPTGTWDGSEKWTSSSLGDTATSSWISGSFAAFAAGTDATGSYTVTIAAPSGITVTRQLDGQEGAGDGTYQHVNDPPTTYNKTESWSLDDGNAVVVTFSAINAESFTATYGGQAMTVVGALSPTRNAYSGIAYIINPVSSTGDVVITAPYDPTYPGGTNTGGYGDYGLAYSILSLSGVDSAGTSASFSGKGVRAGSTLTYSTSATNSFIVGVGSDNNWRAGIKNVTGICSNYLYQGGPAYYNTTHAYGYIPGPGTYSDLWAGQLTSIITLPFEASAASNPVFGDSQKITGLSFDNGTVTLTAGELELQGNNPIVASVDGTGIIESQLTGIAGAGITKQGPGIVQLKSSANNYTGNTNVVDGTLQSAADNVLSDSSPIYIGGYAAGITSVLDLNGFDDTIDSLTLGGATTDSGASVITEAVTLGTLILSGDITYNSTNNPLGASISGALELDSSARMFAVRDSSTASDDLTISAVISGVGGFDKSDFGTLHLSGDSTYTGMTTVSGGLLVLTGDNTGATGGITVKNGGAVCFDTLASINGAGANVKIEAGGLVYFGPSFDDPLNNGANIVAALARIDPTSTGAIAVDNFDTTNFDFEALIVSLGALNDVTYTGMLSANSSGEYRIGGGSGTITLTGLNALTGANSLLVTGRTIITNTNDLSGATTITPSGRLQIGAGGTTGSLSDSATENNGVLAFNHSDTFTQGTDFEAPITGTGVVEQAGSGNLILNAANSYSGGTSLLSGTLSLGHADAIGSGPVALTIFSGTLDVFGPDLSLNLTPLITTINPELPDLPYDVTIPTIALGADFTFGGSADLNMGTGDIENYGNPTITLNGTDSTLTFGGVMTNISGGNQTMTVNGPDNTLVFGGYNMSTNVDATNIDLIIGGTANIAITGPVDDLSAGEFLENYGTLTKVGSGTLTLSGNNKYTGDTVVEDGVLHLESGTQNSPFFVNDGAKLGFTLGTTIDEKEITSYQRLTLNTGAKIRIVGTPTLDAYTLMTASSLTGDIPVLDDPDYPSSGPLVGYVLQFNGNSLMLTKPGDIYPPGLTEIVDDKNGGPIPLNTLVTYTVTFNEDIEVSTVDPSDFVNNPVAGAATINTILAADINAIDARTFTVQVTPTTAGTLQLSIPTTAVILDVASAGNILVVNPALLDDTIIIVEEPYTTWFDGAFDADANGDGIANGLAWLLGAGDELDADSRLLLPVAEEASGAIKLTFITLDSTARGSASVKVQYSKDLGAATWANNQAEVPDTTTSNVNGVDFVIDATTIGNGYIIVEATIPASAALPGTTLFARVSGSETAPPE
jgi:autotransporter-associated beta strand protein